MTQAALPHLARGGAVINTASVVAYKGHPSLLDYSATKGAQCAQRTRAGGRVMSVSRARMHTDACCELRRPLRQGVVHVQPGEIAGGAGEEHPRERRGAGAHLDAAHSRNLPECVAALERAQRARTAETALR
jgi:NAD(P)-dependent dehydrogenase (short-subunit alcohol dehydrogenase family)